MRSTLRLLILFLLLSLSPLALADTAADITAGTIVTNARGAVVKEATDRRPKTSLLKDRGREFYDVSLPEDSACHHIYLELVGQPVPYKVEAQDAAGLWQTVAQAEHPFAHQYFKVEGLRQFRLSPAEPTKKAAPGEIYLYGQGERPEHIQLWQMPEGKMDMMLIVAHPDDELLWFGGTIPYYAGVRDKKLLNVYMAPCTDRRRTELLNGLWHSGQGIYPVLGPFRDIRAKTLQEANGAWGKGRIDRFLVGLLRQWQPDVVLTHAANGEYGHGAHKATSEGAVRAVQQAALASERHSESEAFGLWEVKKLYLHLGGAKGRIEMDWSAPQDRFQGRSSIEVAAESFAKHVSQQGFNMPADDSRLTNRVFQLVHSTVGEDKLKDDFLEHVGEQLAER